MAHHDQIVPLSAEQEYYGVYLGADHSQPIDYIASMAVRARASAPEGVEVHVVPAAQYAVFECAFSQIGRTYGYIWDEWLPTAPYRHAGEGSPKADFERYPPVTDSGETAVLLHIALEG
jgi:predicted transcriptional regulator YdeE